MPRLSGAAEDDYKAASAGFANHHLVCHLASLIITLYAHQVTITIYTTTRAHVYLKPIELIKDHARLGLVVRLALNTLTT